MNPDDADYLRPLVRHGLPTARHPARVVVIGAGMAGLVAADALIRGGHEVVVLEARRRVGGRVHTLREPFSSGLFGEAGAMRIPTGHHLTLEYVKRAGLPVEPFLMENPRGWCVFHGRRHRIAEAREEPEILGFELKANERNVKLSQLWGQTVDRYRAMLEEDPTNGWHWVTTKLESCSLRDMLIENGWSDDAIEMFGMFAGFETLLYGAALEFVREALLGLKDETVFLPGGMDGLPKSLLSTVGPCIRYGSEVTSFDQSPDGVTVNLRTLGGPTSVQADYGIVTLPFSVLRHLEWNHPLSREKQRAVRNLHYEAAVKIFFEARERFWEHDGIVGGSSITDLAVRSLYYPQHGAETGRGVFIASYSHGQDAHRWGALSESERLRQAMENVAVVHPEAPALIELGASKVWMQDPFAGGAYAFFQAHQERSLHHDIVRPEGRYHFAGEHASLTHRWIQGAIESGLRAALEIHERQY